MTGRISLAFVLVALGAMHTSSPLAAQSGPNVAVAANRVNQSFPRGYAAPDRLLATLS